MEPGYYYAHLLLGWTYWAHNEWDLALTELESALSGLYDERADVQHG